MNEFEAGRHVERLTREHEEQRRILSVLAEEMSRIQREVWRLEAAIARDERLPLLQKLSRWWNRSHYRAIEQQLSELRNKQIMDNTEALNKIGQVKANLAEAKAEVLAEIAKLKELVALGGTHEEIIKGLDELVSESGALAKISPSLPTEPPTEPPAQG